MHYSPLNNSVRVLLLILSILLCLDVGNATSDQTQFELNDQMGRDLQDTEAELTATLATIRRQYAEEAQFLLCLAESQLAWEVYRERQLAMIFPYKDDTKEGYGTVFPMCWAIWRARLTKQRITELKLWVDGIEEGEICRGSIRVK
jgi:uncharacterized protein YecT (DUF1311 family)